MAFEIPEHIIADAQLTGNFNPNARQEAEWNVGKILMSRRGFLGAGIGLLATAQGIAWDVLRSSPSNPEALAAECEPPACMVPGSELTLPPTTSTETTVATTETTLPPTTTTTALPPPPPPAQVQATASEAMALYSRNVWFNPGENPREFIARHLPKVPSLEQLAARFGGKFADWQEQLAFIDQLGTQVAVTPEDFRANNPDRSRVNAFNNQQGHWDIIQPQMYVYHWTGKRFEDGVDGLIRGLQSKGLRVANFSDRNAYPFRLFESYRRRGAHAGSRENILNFISQGGEYETETWGPEHGHPQSPTYDFTPALVRQMIIDGVGFCRDPEINLPVDETTLISHYVVDLLFDSDKYNPETGEIFGVDKWDPPQELITRVILPKARELDAALGPRA